MIINRFFQQEKRKFDGEKEEEQQDWKRIKTADAENSFQNVDKTSQTTSENTSEKKDNFSGMLSYIIF